MIVIQNKSFHDISEMLFRAYQYVVKTGLFDSSDPAFGKGIQIRRKRWDYQQVWLLSGYIPQKEADSKRDLKKFKEYLDSGKGLYVLADNAPYSIQADMPVRSS